MKAFQNSTRQLKLQLLFRNSLTHLIVLWSTVVVNDWLKLSFAVVEFSRQEYGMLSTVDCVTFLKQKNNTAKSWTCQKMSVDEVI